MATPKKQSEPKVPNVLFYYSALGQRVTFRAALEAIALEIQRQNPEELWQGCFRMKAVSLIDKAVKDLEYLALRESDVKECRDILQRIILEIFNQA